ncbi:MAG TPA: J domain-containing protein [Acidimicrobiia bacterium]|nr:J domain-containing protein [Acidimicrobiia bacterium]
MGGDFYKRLGVPRSADQDQIHETYLARISDVHPDFVVKSDHHVVRNLNIAYRVLSDPEERRKYDVALTSDVCPWCGHPLPAYALEEHVATHDASDAKDGCVVCGRLPTSRFRYRASTGRGLLRHKHRFEGNLCRTCSTGVFRAMQRRNLTRGPWSIVSFFIVPVDLIRNWVAHRKTSTMQTPQPAVLHYDDETGLGPKVLAFPGVWVSIAASCLVLFLLFQVVVSIGSTPDADVVAEVTTTTVDAHDGWVIGGCARVDMAGRPHQTECGDHYTVVVAFAETQADCPEPYDFYIPLTQGVACFENVAEPGDG